MLDDKYEAKNPTPKGLIGVHRKMFVALDELLKFARADLKIGDDPEFRHQLDPHGCPTCSWQPLRLNIRYFANSESYDFKGEINAVCSVCGTQHRIVRIVSCDRDGDALKEITDLVKEELPVCHCGNDAFYTASYSLFEGDFYDEGVLAGKCSVCGEIRSFVYFD